MTRHATEFGAYEIDSIPSQRQIGHCHGLFVFPEYRGQGFGLKLKLHQMDTLRRFGYDYATCTVDSQNEKQLKILSKLGWNKLSEFKNDRNGSVTQVWGWEVK